jgi:hypothetical protein
MTKPLPRFVIWKRLATGATAFYFTVPTLYRKLGCTIPNEPLGTDYAVADSRAAALNGLFDEWNTARKGGQAETGKLARYGTVDWLFREYLKSESCRERVSDRTRPDYERIMALVAGVVTKRSDKIGERSVKSITPRAADKIYSLIIAGPRGPRLRQGEKVISVCRHAWRVVHRLYPDLFDKAVPNPWQGVTKKRRISVTKPAATREQVYRFAWGCIEAGHPEPAAAAVICFEWLQRPENVIAGYLRWPDYRPPDAPTAIRVFHHKTGAVVWHPLEENDGCWRRPVLPRSRSGPRPAAAAGRSDDPETTQGGSSGPVLDHGHGQARPKNAARPRAAIHLHAGRLPAWWDDRTRRSRTDGRPRPRPLSAQEPARISGICEADPGARPPGHAQAPGASTREHGGNTHSERATVGHSERRGQR